MNYSETELVSEIKKRNVDAYEILINTYTKAIYYVVYNILKTAGSSEDVEECVSDVFLDAWMKINKFNCERGNLKTWLLVLAKYKALTYKRKNMKEMVENIDDHLIDDPVTVERRVINRETQEKLMDTINGFNATDKELFIRRYFFNEKISDLMDSLGLSRSAIDNRLLRGRKIIKEVLSYE